MIEIALGLSIFALVYMINKDNDEYIKTDDKMVDMCAGKFYLKDM